MMKNHLKFLTIFVLFVMVLAACAPAAPQATDSAPAEPAKVEEPAKAEEPAAESASAEPVKIALVLPGVITDNGWNAAAYNGLKAAAEQYGIEMAYSESVPLPDYESTFRDYASKGYKLVIGHGSEFADVALLVGKEFPNTLFAVTNADVKAENVAGLDTKNEEAGYIAGFMAGLVSKTKTVGFVGGMEIVAMKRAELGFKAGVPVSCPDCEVLISWVGSTNDAAKGKETALAQIDKGADVLYQVADAAGLGVIEAAKEKNIKMIGNTGNQRDMAPDHIITSTRRDLAPVITQIVKEVVEGTFQPNTVRMHGFDTGIYYLEDFNMNLVTEEQVAKINAEVERLKKGEVVLEHISAAKK
ncbi:MAG: BMP family protein [Anaerolineae bacterium]|nr:BMP family protein [Anaerolineae bacterium]